MGLLRPLLICTSPISSVMCFLPVAHRCTFVSPFTNYRIQKNTFKLADWANPIFTREPRQAQSTVRSRGCVHCPYD